MSEQTNQNTNNTHGGEPLNGEQIATGQEECVLCKIIDGTIPAYKLYEDDETLALLDIAPTNYGHVLVMPKDHSENIYTLSPEIACRVMLTVQKMAVAVRNGTDADGINIIMNNEPAAGQVIFHAHVHIIPRLNNDGFRHWPHKEYKDEEEKIAYANKIRAEVE